MADDVDEPIRHVELRGEDDVDRLELRELLEASLARHRSAPA